MIVTAFRRIGMSDQAGSGIRAIFRNWHELGYVPPMMNNNKAGKDFELVLLKEPLIDDQQKRFQREVGVHLSPAESDVFAYACEHGRISLLDVRKLTASTQSQARAILDKLVTQVLLQSLDHNLYELTEAMQKRYEHFVEATPEVETADSRRSKEDEADKYRGSTDEVTEVVSDEVKKVVSIVQGEMKRKEIQNALGLKHEMHFREAYLLPSLSSGMIEMTIPDKPRSSKQKYRLTTKGYALLETLHKDKR